MAHPSHSLELDHQNYHERDIHSPSCGNPVASRPYSNGIRAAACFQTWRMLVPVQALFLLPAHTITVMPRTMSGSVSHCPLERSSACSPKKASGSRNHSTTKRYHAVACTEKPRHKACSPRSGGGPPEQDEKQKPLSEGFVELRGVTRARRRPPEGRSSPMEAMHQRDAPRALR